LPGKAVSPKKYRILIKIALLDEIDYSIANVLTEHFWRESKGGRKNIKEIESLLPQVRIGNKIAFWTEKRDYRRIKIKPLTPITGCHSKGDYVNYCIKNPPQHRGINFAEFEVKIEVKPVEWLRSARRVVKKPNGNSIQRLLQSTKFWPVDSRTVDSLRKKMDIDELEDWEKVIWIHHWVKSNIRSYPGPSRRLRVEKTITSKKGNCWEVSDLFVTLCRRYGIPARQLGGWLYQKGKISAGHAWAEVFLEDHGWMPIDALRKSLTLPDYYIPYFATDDGKLPVVYLSKPRAFAE
jgi:hypothetical protein